MVLTMASVPRLIFTLWIDPQDHLGRAVVEFHLLHRADLHAGHAHRGLDIEPGHGVEHRRARV